MAKKEILNEKVNRFYADEIFYLTKNETDKSDVDSVCEGIIKLIDQETTQLREENEEKQKALDYCHKKMALMVNEIERLKSDLSLLEIVVNDSNTLIKSQDKELAELKAKHKSVEPSRSVDVPTDEEINKESEEYKNRIIKGFVGDFELTTTYIALSYFDGMKAMRDKLLPYLRTSGSDAVEFLDSIRDYERESGNSICDDERESLELYELFLKSKTNETNKSDK